MAVMSVNAWGTGATTLNPTNLSITTSEQTEKIFIGDVLIDYVTVGTYDSKLTIKKNATIKNITPVAGKITSIVVSAPTYSGETSGNFIIYGGTSSGATTTAVYSGTSTSQITADFSSYNYQYFYIVNNTGRQVSTASITVNYSGTESGNLIVYPNTFEIEGTLEDGELNLTNQGEFYINQDVVCFDMIWLSGSITTGDDEHCMVDAVGQDGKQNPSESDNFYLNVWADAVGTYVATITVEAWDEATCEEDISAGLTVTIIVSDECSEPTVEFPDAGPIYKKISASSFTNAATVDNDDQTITYSSSNTSVATVSSTGAVTLKGVVGNTTITAAVEAYGDYCAKSATYTLYVYTAPTVTNTNLAVSNITPTSATIVGGQVTNRNGRDISQYGWILNTTSTVDKDNKVTAAGYNANPSLNTNFASKNITGLTAGTTYYVRPFANNGSYGYGPAGGIISFTTPYPITLDKNGGTTDGSAYLMPNGTSLTNISAPTKTGYTLEGYYTTSGVSTKIATKEGALQASVTVSSTDWTNSSSEWVLGANATFYAKWGGTISFDANGGGGSMTPQVVASGDTYELPSCTLTAPSGKVFKCWAEGSSSGTERAVGYEHTVDGNITFYAIWRDPSYTDYKFSCADWELTGPSGDIVFITSTASKTVRSQEAFHVTGTGLPHSTALTFTISPSTAASKFAFKKADGTIPSTDEYGVVDADVYVFYTPGEGDTSDGLDDFTSLTVSVSGEPRSATIDTKHVYGRHLPADFVIAAKNTTTNKWYALPANMSGTGNPEPVEIAVDDINNPTIAYTAASNVYNLYLSGDKEKVQLGMKNNVDGSSRAFALWANNAKSSTDIGKNTGLAESTLGDNYKWTLAQTNTSITNAQDAKYTISNPNNANALKAWFAAGGGPKWGLYSSGEATLRIIPASAVVFTEAYFVEWGQHGGVVEVDAEGVSATSVVAHLGEESSSAITLVQTKASDAKNAKSKYNYTVNFGDGIDFADAASNGAMLTLEWKNGATVKAMSNIVIPKIVASNITINKTNYPLKSDWNTEVHVLPGKTVTIDADYSPNPDVTIKELNIYPGATVVASTGTLIATTLVLRNGWSRAGSKTYDVARLHVTESAATLKATNVYADWYIDYDQYYPIAVPWNATVANFSYRYSSVSPTVGPDANIRLRYYDGASRASNVQEGVGSGANWKQYGEGGNKPVPTTLTPSTGYAMTAKRPTGKAFSIIRMPLTLPSGTWGEGSWTTNGEAGNISTTHKDQVDVRAYGVIPESQTPYAQGWNFIANPYMSLYQGTITLTPEEGAATTINVVNIPDVDFKEYGQYATPTTKLNPSSGFLIQTPATGTITFGTANRKPSAPSYRKEVQTETRPEQQVYIVLNDEKAEDMMGLFVSEQYTAEYDLNGDVEKLLSDGNTLRTYMRYGDMNMAYVAINETLAKEWIPVNVRIPETGEYTYSMHEASIAGELEGVYLIDYQNGDKITNLIEQSYTFSSTAGTINGRFAINAKVGERQTPTGVDIVNGGGDLDSEAPFKFIYHDKVYIYHRGVIYDATGKRVREINK